MDCTGRKSRSVDDWTLQKHSDITLTQGNTAWKEYIFAS